MKKKNNHFVPQFHLRQWSKNKKTIMTYAIKKDIYVPNASIKNQASKNYLYGHNENFENLLCKFEQTASLIYNKIITTATLDCLNDYEYDFIYFYINLCNERTNSRAEESSEFLTELVRTAMKMEKAHNSPLTENITLEQIENAHFSYDNPNFMSVKAIIESYPITFDLDCILVQNTTKNEFLTSDYPTIVYNLFSNKHNIFSGWGMASGGIIYILTINPKFALMLYDSVAYDCDVKNNIVKIDNINDIKEINRLTILNSEFCVYGSENVPHNYLKNLKKNLPNIKSSPYDIWGDNVNSTLIALHRKRLNYLANFSFLKINDNYDKIPIPRNAAGIIRPAAEEMEKKLKNFWNKEKTPKEHKAIP